MKYEPTIGLEVHAQLKTKSKMFCGCPTEFGKAPNDQVCPVCLGMPGMLPVINKRAVEYGIKAGLALNCEISHLSRFDRKNYFYPDLSKGYQISQFDKPVCHDGYLTVSGKKVRIKRAHLEEDAGKLVHAGAAGLHGSDYSLVDFNRSGVPLLEIVSEPDIESAEVAQEYLTELRNILRYVDVCDGNLEEGSFRCDANVSIKPLGASELGTRTEIKNMNSFRAVKNAIESEIKRQIELVEKGERVVMQTRLWNEADGKTYPMRSKEEAHDYRYFPEPDLVPLAIGRTWVEEIRETLPELPEARRQRYIQTHGLTADYAIVLAENKDLADFFDKVLTLGTPAQDAAKYIVEQTKAYLNDTKREFSETSITPENIRDLVQAVAAGTIGTTVAKPLLLDLLNAPGDVNQLIKDKGLAQISDEGSLRTIVQEVLDKSHEQTEEYKSGKVKVRQFFFGKIMKATSGKANPEVINKILDDELAKLK